MPGHLRTDLFEGAVNDRPRRGLVPEPGFTPRNVEVSAEERARLLEKGFFNQY